MTNKPFSLPSELLMQCRETFLECEEFGTPSHLAALFSSSELKPFRVRLPRDTALSSQVDRFLAYLIPEKLADGQSAFLFFLKMQAERYTGSEMEARLTELGRKVDQYFYGESGQKPSEQKGKNSTLDPIGANSLLAFRDRLVKHFSPDEITELCLALNLDFGYEGLAGEGTSARALYLIKLLDRRGRTDELVAVVESLRPSVRWRD